ncbi:MAG TPA: hypothetical protein VN641_22040 [Urbifossiella sp.]|nr:hypothetical protein [Urbifossiella sp.]
MFLILTEGRGMGEGDIECVLEETGQKIFETQRHAIRFGADPLEILGLPFRIQSCPFSVIRPLFHSILV